MPNALSLILSSITITAAFDAGYAVAKGKSLITIHPPDLTHALKEIDAAAMATTENTEQVIEILTYITQK